MKNNPIVDNIQRFAVDQALKYLEGNPEENFPKLIEYADRYLPKGAFDSQRATLKEIARSDSNWHQLVLKLYELDPGVRKTFFRNFMYNASIRGLTVQDERSKAENCNIPWTMLLDPTSACNLHCTGCWAAEYGNQLNLSLETLDSIITQGKELGTYMYLYTGGEPLVRKKDIIKLCEMHPDCYFMAFTNGTLIDEAFCQDMLRVKNFMPAISLEGFEEANDGRRGKGVYQKVRAAMALLKEHKLPFGTSTCYTSANMESVTSEEFFDMLVECGALFAWFFHYMPVGNSAAVNLLPTPEQRETLYRRICHFRETKPIFSIDFQNDGGFTKGCIAGGRRYLHINAKGDVEPCAFIHYSNVNIHDCTLLEALKSPLFQAYHDNQPFNDNHFRPCPMLENPDALRRLVKETGAVNTDYQAPEDVDHLCDKCEQYAADWKPTAEKLWEERERKGVLL